jgi:23S rRNA (adenine-N6)-dimethyltransferase
VAGTTGPVVEIGPGDGVLTAALASLHRPVTAVEVDARRVRRLTSHGLPGVRVVAGDVLRWPFPARPHVVAGNVPFHLTTPILRRLLHERHWTDAVLLVQWEVARKRAAGGGTTMMTAMWWPWYTFEMAGRVPASAFRPVPAVDGGILTVRRRAVPLVTDRAGYQRLVHEVFTGGGRGLGEILPRSGACPGGPRADGWGSRDSGRPSSLETSPAASGSPCGGTRRPPPVVIRG